ncbi:MAG TPA: tetratricopeptide repeat protein [Chloroflexota bacterium]|nr:tetratricopeptide repeat protein [Chloroflexota bacterium]
MPAQQTLLERALEHHNAGRLADAERLYREILTSEPDHASALHLLGMIAFQTGHPEAAIDLVRQASSHSPNEALFHTNLAVVLRSLDRLEEALESAETAARLEPNGVTALLERGQALYAMGRSAEASATFETVLAREPDNAMAHLGIALAALIHGDFQRGWAEYEARWRYKEYAPAQRGFTQPLWDGRPLDGRTILLHAEQGLGDTLQFVRYAPLLAGSGGRVVLECQPELKTLLDGVAGVDQVVARGETLPPFDVHAPLMSLPWLCGTGLETIPADSPYLRAAPVQTPRLPEDGRLRVGLVWAGSPGNKNDHQRSVSLTALAPLGGVEGVAFYSLQKGPQAEQLRNSPPGLPLTDLGPRLHDFADTAAVLRQIDLLITVDTSVAHLAGALGIPTWLMLPFAPDFRWLLDRHDSPWYPSLRLFRQSHRGDWSGVLDRVTASLDDLAKRRQGTGSAGQSAKPLVLALPVNSNIGWGVCGRQITRELASLDDVRLETDPFDAHSVGEDGAYAALRTLVPPEWARSTPGQPAAVDAPLLQAIASNDFEPYRPDLRSTRRTVGYTFFEQNILTPDAVRRAIRTFDHIVAGSTWCEQVLREHGLETVSTIVQGVDTRVFRPAADPRRQKPDRFTVFSGGKLEFRKGQDLVLRAFKVLQDRHRDVLLVNAWYNPWPTSMDTMAASPYIAFERSTDDYAAFMQHLLVANGIDEANVLTLPPMPNTAFPNVYWNSDVGLFPNRCEGGTNLVLMEYMASGKPVIASYSSGHRDIVSEQNARLITEMSPLHISDGERLIAVWDAPSLEQTIEQLEWAYQHQSELARLGAQAAHDLAQYTWARTAAEFHGLLR